jgi:hypothetical protein
MHTPDEQAWERGDLFEEVTVENVEADRTMRYSATITLALCHPDIPEDISLGTLYVRGTPRQLRKALASEVSAILRDLEAGISETRRASLSFTRDGSPLYRSPVASPGVVRGRGKRR